MASLSLADLDGLVSLREMGTRSVTLVPWLSARYWLTGKGWIFHAGLGVEVREALALASVTVLVDGEEQ